MSRKPPSTHQRILSLEISSEHDIVLTRQRARQVSQLLGFEQQDQVRVATAASEVARHSLHYGGGKVVFQVQALVPQVFQVAVSYHNAQHLDLQALLDGSKSTSIDDGLMGAKRLMDRFEIQSKQEGGSATVLLTKAFPKRAPALTPQDIGQISQQLVAQVPANPFDEVRQQNQELLHTLDELRSRQAELTQLNRELDDTNRGVVALYAELNEKADYLQKASELKSHFLSNMSHEFRTPLNAILSLGRLLLDRVDGELTPEQDKQVQFIRKSAQELSEMVNDLLDLAKVESGKISVRPQEFTVADLFAALRGMLRPLVADHTAVTLLFEEPMGIPPLYSDEAKLAQILRNFISNALKFTEEGTVEVAATCSSNNTVIFSVTDTGIGIALEDQERIFEEFIQVDAPIQKRVKGTGLGLPLSRRLAELLGGRVSLVSQLGVGSTFSVTIPTTYTETQEKVQEPAKPQPLDPGRSPVLVIEDNPETLFTYEKYLKPSPFQCIAAQTLTQAREFLNHHRPVAIVLDILLQKENSWDFLRDLKSQAATKDIPVLVVTMVDNQAQAIALGANAFSSKPVDRDWLLSQLQAVVTPTPTTTILVIDDEEVYRYLLRGWLSHLPCQIIEANNGTEGLRRAQTDHPQLIILDLIMPGKSGHEVLTALKADPATQHIPVIIHTSKVLDDAEYRQVSQLALTIISKDQSSQELGVAEGQSETLVKIQQALKHIGLGPEASSQMQNQELNHG